MEFSPVPRLRSVEFSGPSTKYFLFLLLCPLGFPGGSVIKNLPAKQEMRVQSLGQEDPVKEEMATHSSLLVWKIPWKEEPGRL